MRKKAKASASNGIRLQDCCCRAYVRQKARPDPSKEAKGKT